MICRQCGKFISTEESMVGKTVPCPFCASQQAVTRDAVLCQCPECQQEYELESWMEGESFACRVCSKNVVLAGKHELPKAPVSAPAVPHFRKAGGDAAAAVSAPASAASPVPAAEKTTAAAPSFKTARPAEPPAAVSAPVTASAPANKAPSFKMMHAESAVSAPAPAVETPSFKPKNPETASEVPKAPVFELKQPVQETSAQESSNSMQPVVPALDLLPAARQYFESLCVRKEKKDGSPETALGRFIRTHIKPTARFLLCAVAVIPFIAILCLLYSLICRFATGASSGEIKSMQTLVESGNGGKLSQYLSGISDSRRSEIEDELLKKAIKDKNKKNLIRLFRIVSPYGHDFLLRLPDQEIDFTVRTMLEGKFCLENIFSDGSTLLEVAAERENYPLFQALLEAGADPNHAFKDGLPPLFHLFDEPEYLKTLLKHKKINVCVTDWEGDTLLFKALEKKEYNLLRFIMDRQGSFSRKNSEGWTCLLLLLSDDKIPNRLNLIQEVLKYPCAINEAGPDGKTALKVAMEKELYKSEQGLSVMRQMLYSGAKPYDGFQKEIEGTPLYTVYFSNKAFLDSHHPKKEKNIIYTHPKKPVFPMPDLEFVILVILYLAAGLFALRLAEDSKASEYDEWRNTAILAGGFFSLIIVLVCRYCSGIVGSISGMIDKIVDHIHQDFVHFYDSEGKEYIKVTNPDLIPAMVLARPLFDRIVRGRITEAVIVPKKGNCQILFLSGKKEKIFRTIDTGTGNQLMKLLKSLAGMNPAETVKPQNGSFSVSLDKKEKQILFSTIGLGASGERGRLLISDKALAVSDFDQLVLSAEDRKTLQDFVPGTGLVLVAGTAGNGRRTFISLLLEKLAKNGDQVAWIGDGSEPEGSDRVPHLKIDSVAGMSVEQLLDAIPEYPAVAVTLGANRSALPKLIDLAETKKIILLIDGPVNAAAALCRQASSKFDQVLKLAVRPWLLKELDSRTGETPLPPEMQSIFKMICSAKNTVPAAATSAQCIIRRFVLYETGLLNRPAPSVALLTALKLAEAGKIGLDDLKKIWKGE